MVGQIVPGIMQNMVQTVLWRSLQKKILDFQVVQVSKVSSSNAMEPEGCNRCLNTLLKNGVKVRCLAIDRHATVSSNMRKLYPSIIHQYDTGMVAKTQLAALDHNFNLNRPQAVCCPIPAPTDFFQNGA